MLIASLSCVERAASQTFPSVYGRIKRLKRGNLKETQDNEGPVMIHVSGHITPRIQPEDAVTFLTPIKKKNAYFRQSCVKSGPDGEIRYERHYFFVFFVSSFAFLPSRLGAGLEGVVLSFLFLLARFF